MFAVTRKFINSKQRIITRLLLLALLAIMVLTLLAACGDTPLVSGTVGTATPASTTANSTTAATTTAVPPTIQQTVTTPPTVITLPTVTVSLPTATPVSTSQPQPTATQQPATTQPGQPATPNPTATIPAVQTSPVYNPVIRFSTTSVNIGGSMTVSGSGFPAGAKLAVSLVLPEIGPVGPYASPAVDDKGNFSATVVFEAYPGGKELVPGKVTLKVNTQDGQISASAPLTLVAPPADYNPLVIASLVKVQLGQEITLNGSGFPANLSLEVVGGVQNPNENYGTVKTDAQGKFSLKVTLPTKTGIKPGLYFIYVSSADFKFQAKAQFDVQPAAYAPVLNSSLLQVKLGQEITLTGSGFPASMTLSVGGGVQNLNEDYGSPKTDAQGNFSLKVKVPADNRIALGQYFIYASSADFKYQAKVELKIVK